MPRQRDRISCSGVRLLFENEAANNRFSYPVNYQSGYGSGDQFERAPVTPLRYSFEPFPSLPHYVTQTRNY